MSRVSISAKHARSLIAYFGGARIPSTETSAIVASLRDQLAPRPKSSAVSKTERKRRAKSEELKALREVVFRRAGGQCESCRKSFSPADPGELDHFFGRGKASQTARNCWALCHRCHRNKTNNTPSAAFWLKDFGDRHCGWYGYQLEKLIAGGRLEVLAAKGMAGVTP